jgi:hypothetical protein
MATINNMIGGNFNSIANRASQNQMNELRNSFRNNELTSQEYREQMEELRGQREDLRTAAAEAGLNAANNVADLFSYMNNGGSNQGGGIWGAGTFDQSIFTNAGSQMSQLQAMNSARIGIEGRARELVNEIGRDRAMGRDVSDRQEALSNLTGNLDILNRNLSNSIDRALSENGGRDANTVDVLGRIRDTIATRAPVGSPVPNEVPTPGTNPPAEEEAAADSAVQAPAAAQAAMAEDNEPASFEVPTAFEGSAAEAAVAASQEQDYDDMSVAAQIASNAQSDYAQAIDIMNEEAAENTAENPVAGAERPIEDR